MTKRMDNTQLINELKGASAFFSGQGQPSRNDAESDTTADRPDGPDTISQLDRERTGEPGGRTERANGTTEEESRVGFVRRLSTPDAEARRRSTKRYSFEIYEDQLELIDEIQFLYRRATGEKLSASQLLRDIIDAVEYVLRHTWGFQEYDQTKRITLDEFCSGRKRTNGSRLDKGTGLSKPSVIAGLQKALKRGLLLEEVDDRDRARVRKSYALRMQDENNQLADDLEGNRSSGGVKDFDIRVKTFDTGGQDSVQRSEKETSRRETSSSAVVADMIRHGLSHRTAQFLTQNYSQNRIQEKLGYLEFALKRRKPRITKPSGWLRKAIEDDYEAPEGYISPEVEADRAKRREFLQRKSLEELEQR